MARSRTPKDHPAGPPGPCAVDALVEEARRTLLRVTAEDLDREVAAGALLVDLRPVEQRERDGAMPGATVIDRNVLEWRLDPTSPYRLAVAADAGRRIVLVCNEGYSSSLAAATLQRLGLRNATDLVGGFQAWLTWRTGPGRRPPRVSRGSGGPARSAGA